MSPHDPYRVPRRLRERLDEIVARTDAFAAEHLNEEYAELCRRMAAALAHKRPSPLERGEARTWAAGILYAVGWVNFLADPSEEPHMTTAELARNAGVGQSTVAARFREIRDALDLVNALVLPAVQAELPPERHFDRLSLILETRFLWPLEGFRLAEMRGAATRARRVARPFRLSEGAPLRSPPELRSGERRLTWAAPPDQCPNS